MFYLPVMCNYSLSLCPVTVVVMRPKRLEELRWCTAAALSITYTHMVCSEEYRWVIETNSYTYLFDLYTHRLDSHYIT